MKLALIMNKNSFAGREYLSQLTDIDLDLICINKLNSEELENERCEGLWNPPPLESFRKDFNFYEFQDLNSNELIDFLREQEYDFGIQGGTGIIKKEVFKLFKTGIINFHPGDLPCYRGCSTPEWQIYERKEVFCTAHLIDEGIDSGNIIQKKKLNVDLLSYGHFRSSIYPEISKFVRDIIHEIKGSDEIIRKAVKQNEHEAQYRKVMNTDTVMKVKNIINSMTV